LLAKTACKGRKKKRRGKGKAREERQGKNKKQGKKKEEKKKQGKTKSNGARLTPIQATLPRFAG
jgi:hypothetical protein